MEEQKAKWVFDQGGFSKALVVPTPMGAGYHLHLVQFGEGGGNQRVGTPEGRLASLQDDRYCCLYCQNHRVPAHRGRFDLPLRQVPPLIQTRREILLLPWPCGGRGQRPVGVGNPCGQGSGRAVFLARPPLSIGLSMPLEGRSPEGRLSTHPQG